jgi:putative endonuclease
MACKEGRIMGKYPQSTKNRKKTKEYVKYNKRKIGGMYENIAANYLISKGAVILKRNYRCRSGEIDLIALDGEYLVFAEVKYRSTGKKGMPAEAVNVYKQKRIRDTAGYYLYTHHYPQETRCRLDVISILGDQIQWIQNAF